ncbi:hypothetical protein GCM10009798_19130 [Nocardioides panacihumi]|uniref:Transcriptional regulator, AbiEi antitoxin, Type IV TA system n=1 Tax=Nocardioides panacihumi TaxID=400774 RepID=A0ABN2QX22_9ACTN
MTPDDPMLTDIWLRRELLASGENEKTLRRALQAGLYRRPRTGAYVDGAVWDAASAEARYAIKVRAAYRQAKTEVVISHASALLFNEAPSWGVDLSEVHLTRLDGKTGRREAGIRQHCGRLADGDVRDVHGLQVIAPLRNCLEVSTAASVEVALVVVNHFLHRGDFTLEELRERYANRMDRWPHSLTTDLVLRLANPLVESVGESRTSYFFWKQRLPTPVPQYEVYDGSVLVARLDFAIPELGVWFEFDGRIKYQGEVDPSDVVFREKRREDLVRELTGWRCFRITWKDLADPRALAERIRAFIARVLASA